MTVVVAAQGAGPHRQPGRPCHHQRQQHSLGHPGRRSHGRIRGRIVLHLCRASRLSCAGPFRRRSKGEASCAMGLGCDGAGDCNALWGNIVAITPSGVRINRWFVAEARERTIWERSGKTSPAYALGKVCAPTLIHVVGSDERCPAGHSRMLYRAPKEHVKVPAELIVYPGEPPGLTKHVNRKAKMEGGLARFDRCIRGQRSEGGR